MLGQYAGMKIIELPLTTQTKTPVRNHKKKRIKKKFIKRYGYKSKITPSDKIYVFNDTLFMHPIAIHKLEEEIVRRLSDDFR